MLDDEEADDAIVAVCGATAVTHRRSVHMAVSWGDQ
jgi:hypothetical protein